MEIANDFSLGVPLEETWALLGDLGRVAAAMPGATVDAVDADGVRVTMKVKVGPISVAYRARVEIVSRDEAAHVAVLRATGREARGQGTVEATVTAALRGDGARTDVALTTDLAVTGRVAQFGGGVMKEVADRLLKQFARRLEAQLAAPVAVGAGSGAGAMSDAGAGSSVNGAGEGGADAAAGVGASAAPSPAGAPAAPSGQPAPVAPAPAPARPLVPAGPALDAFVGGLLGALLATLLLGLLRRRA
jgi:carbon monoxide dehydrogenase subunit G